MLQGHRQGDNAQGRELARQLGAPTALKPLRYNVLRILPNLFLRSGLASIDQERSADLSPPWPDIVIATGKRSVPVARWIKTQSGGRSRLIHLGRPRAPLSWFDLVITTPQYGLPLAPNVIEIPLPLARPTEPDAAELAIWRTAFGNLPRPWTGVLVGGEQHPYRLDSAVAKRLAETASTRPGALLVSTSPRTSPTVIAKLKTYQSERVYVHQWTRRGANPHQSILALADQFIVTSDSVSMIAEAAATQKPVEIFQLPQTRWRVSWSAKSGIGAWLARRGLMTPPRDASIIRAVSRTHDDQIVERIDRLMQGR